jgi:hypothetical protein
MQWSRFRLLDIYFDTGRLDNSKEKIHIGLELVSRDNRDQHDHVAVANQGCAIGLIGDSADFKRIKDDHENQFLFFDQKIVSPK